MRIWAADLHLHSALSPCALEEMTPPAIVRAAREVGLDLIAICDHNAAGNAAAVQRAAARLGGPGVIAGIEVTTAEEAHLVGLFPDASAAEAVAQAVQVTLPLATPVSLRFGEQLLLDEQGEPCGHEPRMLNAPSALPLEAAVRLIQAHGGLAIAAHLDRPSYSVLSQLGLFPADAGLDAVEVSALGRAERLAKVAAFGLPVVTSSDSHFLSDIGICRTLCQMQAPTFAELALALRGVDGRGCTVA